MKTTQSNSPKSTNKLRKLKLVPGISLFSLMQKFPTEEAVIKYFIESRYGKNIACHHCGCMDKLVQMEKRKKFFQCNACNNTFSIFKNTIFENTKLDLRKWMIAINHMAVTSKKGISACQLQREIEVMYSTAWRLLNKIRIAMGNNANFELFKTIVEVDETYLGGKPRKGRDRSVDDNKRGRGTKKTAVVGVLDRESGAVFTHVMTENNKGKKLTGKQLLEVINKHVNENASIITDEFRSYRILEKMGRNHFVVNHSKEYMSKEGYHTNNIENFWSLVKRMYHGTYHKISTKYMQNYLSAQAFTYSMRFDMDKIFDTVLKQAVLEK